MTESGAVGILPLAMDDIPRTKKLMRKYRDLPMDLADAALARVVERQRLRRILTPDRREFQAYHIIPLTWAASPYFHPIKPVRSTSCF